MSKLSRSRILIVDDETSFTTLLTLTLRPLNVEIIVANDGNSGIEKARHHHPDIILTDLMMPDTDGFALMTRVLAENPHLPIIVFTAFDKTDIVIKALKLGAYDFLVKPTHAYVIRETVLKAQKQHLRRKLELWRTEIAEALTIPQTPKAIVLQLLKKIEQTFGARTTVAQWGGSQQSRLIFPPNGNSDDTSLLLDWIDSLDFATDSAIIAQADGQLPARLAIAFSVRNAQKFIVALGHTEPNYFDAYDLHFLNAIAPIASLSLDKALAFQSMEALYQAGLAITSTLSHTDVLNTIIEKLVELTELQNCRITRLNETQDSIIIERHLEKTRGGWAEKTSAGNTVLLANEPVIQAVLQNQRLKLIQPHTATLGEKQRAWMLENDIALHLIIPLIVKNRSIGTIELMTNNADAMPSGNTIKIAQALAAQAAVALENAHLHEAEASRLEREMELAHRIQVSLLPQESPQVPRLSIAARSVSARQVGGDFYRYFTFSDNKFGIAIGDVSGKGVPAALFMAITITELDNQIRQHRTPADILTHLNRQLYTRMKTNGMNTGLLIGIFDLDVDEVTIANAGMISPLVRQKDKFEWLPAYGMPIGAMSDAIYENQTLSLTDANAFVFSSDGIVEANNAREEIFGFERFEASVSGQDFSDSGALLEHIWHETATFIHDADPHDDMTLMVVQRQPHRA